MKRGKDKPTLVGDVNPSPLGDGAHALSLNVCRCFEGSGERVRREVRDNLAVVENRRILLIREVRDHEPGVHAVVRRLSAVQLLAKRRGVAGLRDILT